MLREARRSAIAHNKFMVRTPRGRRATEVWTGSTNLSLGGIAGQTNVGHWVRDPAVAAAFRATGTLLATDPGGRDGRPRPTSWRRTRRSETAVAALSPVPRATCAT